MQYVPFYRHFRITRRMLIVFLLSIIFAFGSNSSLGAAAAIKYTHHGPLASALSGRSVHEDGSSGSNVAKTITGSGRSTGNTLQTSSTAVASNNNNGEGEAGGEGEVLVPKTFPLSAQEPTCEQLRAMWIFSRRQSRAAEITNEIPTYRDPFAYNVWEPYYSTTRSLGAVRMVPHFGDRSRSPVFGRIINREPLLPQRFNLGQRQRHTSSSDSRYYGAAESKPISTTNGRRASQYRYVGANGPGSSSSGSGSTLANGSGQANSVAVQGSFQKLKELIWTERAKELTQQRRAEEMAARAAVLREIANGQNVQAHYKPTSKSESYLMDENRSPDRDNYEHMNDDHRIESIASGQSQILGRIPDQKKQNHNSRNIGTPRSYNGKSQKSSASYFSSNNGSGRTGRHMLPSSYSYEETGVPRSYPMRPSHFRERNRSLFKQHSPGEYFQRDTRQKISNKNQKPEPISDNMIFERLINELNQRILQKQQETANSIKEDPQLDEEKDPIWLDDNDHNTFVKYDDDDDDGNPLAISDDQYADLQIPDYF